MAATPSSAYSYDPAFSIRSEKPAVDSARLQKSLETLFPDLLLHGTRSCLLGMTSSLTKVSGKAHDFFSHLSQALAFDRMMRSFMRFTAAASPFPVEFGNLWSGMMQPASPWGFPMQQPKPASALGFFTPSQPQMAGYGSPGMRFPSGGFQPPAQRPSASWPDYGMMMFAPMAMLAAFS
jgi:hypothetical protein